MDSSLSSVPPVASPAAADHGDVEAVGSDQRSKNQRGLVAYAAGGVLVDLFAGEKLRSRTSPECSIAWVREAVSRVSSAQHDCHEPCTIW